MMGEMSEKKSVAVIFGGRSPEHEISCISAGFIAKGLREIFGRVVNIYIDKSGNWHRVDDGIIDFTKLDVKNEAESCTIEQCLTDVDIVWPVLHGSYGEDGKIQGLFEMYDVPYVGCNVTASAIAMDKVIAKNVFEHAGLKTVKYELLLEKEYRDDEERELERIEKLGFPMFVKPANMGSSVGISKVTDEKKLKKAIEDAFQYDYRLIIEENIIGKEVEVAVFGNGPYEASVAGEIRPRAEFYDVDAKYHSGGDTAIIIPADISEEQMKMLQEEAKIAARAIDCKGICRVDSFIKADSNEIFINEVNTMPGFTEISMYPKLWEVSGISNKELLERIINYGYETYKGKSSRDAALRGTRKV